MKTVTLDIETIAPRFRPPEDDPGKFAPLPYHEPVVICWLCVDSNDPSPFTLKGARFDVDDERNALAEIAKDIDSADRLITYNGRGFDMPVLGLRALFRAVDWSFWHSWRQRYDRQGKQPPHIDLCDQLTDFGAGRKFKLGELAELLDLPGKLADGGDVKSMWDGGDEGRLKVVDYCEHDVYLTWMAYLRWVWTFDGKHTGDIWKASKEWWHARQEG